MMTSHLEVPHESKKHRDVAIQKVLRCALRWQHARESHRLVSRRLSPSHDDGMTSWKTRTAMRWTDKEEMIFFCLNASWPRLRFFWKVYNKQPNLQSSELKLVSHFSETAFFPSTINSPVPLSHFSSCKMAFPTFLPPSPFFPFFQSPRILSRRSRSRSSSSRFRISCNSLEDSKRESKSPYDNIPDLNQQYIAELNWLERQYGPDRLSTSKDIVKEAQSSILYNPKSRATRSSTTSTSTTSDSSSSADLSDYNNLRNQLLSDTLFLGSIGITIFWSFSTLKQTTSFTLGLAGSLVYVYLLSRSVDRLATSARAMGQSGGDALQPARIAILMLLIVFSAKHADTISILPVLFGFFVYKLASLIPLLTGEAFE